MSSGEFSSTNIAMSGEIGRCSTISTMHCISEFHFRAASYIDVTWCHLLVSWLLSVVRLVAGGIGSVMRLQTIFGSSDWFGYGCKHRYLVGDSALRN